eukprot:TRINITY_DN230_c2_g3_i2.p1 TRINITY_DN230_c2_g3~~TRINITY_DN230_c2_g3_i2.p1  ORF type:complete len:124 (+),score=15.87 TRINITY_DN230_c2_g3_i2:38-409(+)
MANSSEESTNDQQSSQPELTRELSGYYGDNEMIELSRGHSDTLMLSTDVHLDAVFAPDYTIPVSLTVLTDDQLNGILTDMGISEDTVNMFNRLYWFHWCLILSILLLFPVVETVIYGIFGIVA